MADGSCISVGNDWKVAEKHSKRPRRGGKERERGEKERGGRSY
jgi:hypothetical protein